MVQDSGNSGTTQWKKNMIEAPTPTGLEYMSPRPNDVVQSTKKWQSQSIMCYIQCPDSFRISQ